MQVDAARIVFVMCPFSKSVGGMWIMDVDAATNGSGI